LCTLRRGRRLPRRNTHYRAGATPYPGRTCTGWITPALPGAPMAGLRTPLSTLRIDPRGPLRMTRGRCGSLSLHRKGLAPSTSCRSPGAPVHTIMFITASSYLAGPGFVGVREVMRRTFDELWIINLGGDNLGPRKTENVFPIQNPVAIAIGFRGSTPHKDRLRIDTLRSRAQGRKSCWP
jgi:hypothetical protein